MKINTSSILSYFTIIFLSVSAIITTTFGQPQTTELFNKSWYFHMGDVNNAKDPFYDDSNWKLINLPHDWSIEGLAQSITKKEDKSEFNIVRGEWKFNRGDNLLWKNPDLDDNSWQIVNLPSTWEQHSNYTQDNVYGWYRREIFIPANLEGKDIYINLGKIDDVDETYFNGVKVGGMG